MLIDGDNAQPSLIDKILAETTKYGLIKKEERLNTAKEAYDNLLRAAL